MTGDLPGVALLMRAHGARRVYCVDRFEMLQLGDFAAGVVRDLLEGLSGAPLERARVLLVDPERPQLGFLAECIDYVVALDGVSGAIEQCDLVVSRTVLEHVNKLQDAFLDMARALKAGGLAVHKVELCSHGLHESTVLDFLTLPHWLWNLMCSGKGAPNRLRIDAYRNALARIDLQLLSLEPHTRYELEQVEHVRARLAPEFSHLTDEELVWQTFWLTCRKPVREPR